MHSIIKQQIGQIITFFVFFALALFLPAGTLVWQAGWIFLALFFSCYLVVTFWLIRHNPGLLEERLRLSRPNQQGWDKVLFPLLMIGIYAWLIFLSFDAGRLHWSPVPPWLQFAGAIVLVCSFVLLFLTFRENTYLSTVVRIQEERGHALVSTGPYQYVRHPMYAAILVFMIGASLLLGSWYGILVGLMFLTILGRRAMLEERTLQRELPGYTAYMARVKYRIVPYVW